MGKLDAKTVIQNVTGMMAKAYSRSNSTAIRGASGCVDVLSCISRTRFCADGIAPCTEGYKSSAPSSHVQYQLRIPKTGERQWHGQSQCTDHRLPAMGLGFQANVIDPSEMQWLAFTRCRAAAVPVKYQC